MLCYAKSLQSCPTLCDPIDGSPPGSPVPGILQARTLEWVAISFSSAWKWKVKVESLSRVQLFATPWTAAHQAPPSMGFSRQEYWSGVPLPRDQTHILCIARWILYHWTAREVPEFYIYIYNFFRFLSIINYYKILNIVPCGPCYLSFSNVLFMTLFLL